MSSRQIVVVGGGAAGFFAAIRCAELNPGGSVTVLERGAQFLAKVRISGGGRCNVTHACFEPRELAGYFPRGGNALIGPFTRFQPRDTVAWFELHGVKLKTERDGRMFPVTDSSETIVDCLLGAAEQLGIKLHLGYGVEEITLGNGGGFKLRLRGGESLECDRLLLATGGCRTAAGGVLTASLGHTLEPPVPSLFTFHIDAAWLRELAGVSVEAAEVSAPTQALRVQGPVLLTHWGLSGPAVLRLSAWGARAFHDCGHNFHLHVNWLPQFKGEAISAKLMACRQGQPARRVTNTSPLPLPARLWGQLVCVAGIDPETRWADLSRQEQHRLAQQLARTELLVTGKSLNKEEFVTCGGVRLGEVEFKTMESRLVRGLYFAGELLDIDGLTGGFNFQAAWTTGWIAGSAMVQD